MGDLTASYDGARWYDAVGAGALLSQWACAREGEDIDRHRPAAERIRGPAVTPGRRRTF